MAAPYDQNLSDCFAESIGEGGLAQSVYRDRLDEASASLDRIRAAHAEGALPLLRLPERRDDLRAFGEVAAEYRDNFDDVIVLGTGGSSLGGRTLCALAEPAGERPRIHFMENVDPHAFAALLDSVAFDRTGVIAISKSGSTVETMTQTALVLDSMRKALGGPADRMVAITQPGDSPLAALAERFGMQRLDHDPDVGGRFSALSVTGLLPAMVAGLDPVAVREGAASVLDSVLRGEEAPPPACGAAAAAGLGRGVSVLMPYCDRLAPFARWYCQLWAESLGKDGLGATPVGAVGTVDQHSQLQLYLDGPADKMFTLILTDSVGNGGRIADDLAADIPYMRGRTMGDLFDAEARATAAALARRGRPVRVFRLAAVDERALGALMMHFMLETIIAADLLGVNPFDQPAVEEGKVFARAYLSGAGS